jgi:hypothetical protein
MSPDLQELEANLRGLHPAALDRNLLARLEDSANGTFTRLSPAEAQFENSLRHIRPAKLPPSLMAAFEAALTGTAPVAANPIITFPQGGPPSATHIRHRYWPTLAAAAAVALLGAAAALFVPGKGPQQTAAAPTSPPPQAAPFAAAPAPPADLSSDNFVLASRNTGLSQAKDQGVLWQAKSQPHRVVKVVYWDRVTLVNPAGKKIECEQPRVEYLLVPEKID